MLYFSHMSEYDHSGASYYTQTISTSETELPGFETWKSSLSFTLAPDSPRGLTQLYNDIKRNEVALITLESGETARYGKVAAVDVFYRAADGKVYKVEEQRYKLNPGRTLDEFLAGDETAAIASSARPALSSLSERINLDGESPEDATIRALKEEIFHEALAGREEEFPDMDKTLKEHVQLGQPKRAIRAKDAIGNSYQGLTSILDEYPSVITFTPDTHVPITTVNDVPQALYEYEHEKGYVNLFVWKEHNPTPEVD